MITRPRFRVNTWFESLLACTRATLPARFACGLATLAVWAQSAAIFAQGRSQPPAEAPAQKSYILSYFLVVLCVALGLLVVCRSGSRAKEPKLDNLES